MPKGSGLTSEVSKRREAYMAEQRALRRQGIAQRKIDDVREWAVSIYKTDKKYLNMTVAQLMDLPDAITE